MFSWRMLSILPLLTEYVNNLSTYFICFLPAFFVFIEQIGLFFFFFIYRWILLVNSLWFAVDKMKWI